MPDVAVRKPSAEDVERLGILQWDIWECGVSSFPWTYGEPETCLFLEGEVVVSAEGRELRLGPGDLVRFPAGLSCVWTVLKPVRKHYRFGD